MGTGRHPVKSELRTQARAIRRMAVCSDGAAFDGSTSKITDCGIDLAHSPNPSPMVPTNNLMRARYSAVTARCVASVSSGSPSVKTTATLLSASVAESQPHADSNAKWVAVRPIRQPCSISLIRDTLSTRLPNRKTPTSTSSTLSRASANARATGRNVDRHPPPFLTAVYKWL